MSSEVGTMTARAGRGTVLSGRKWGEETMDAGAGFVVCRKLGRRAVKGVILAPVGGWFERIDEGGTSRPQREA